MSLDSAVYALHDFGQVTEPQSPAFSLLQWDALGIGECMKGSYAW